MKMHIVAVVAILAAQTALAQPSSVPPADAASASQASEEAAVRSVLSQYKNAIERLDARGTEQLFTTDSAIFETGGTEGTYANYLSHHLGPELHEFKSFKFSDYKVDVHLFGPAAAHAIEPTSTASRPRAARSSNGSASRPAFSRRRMGGGRLP